MDIDRFRNLLFADQSLDELVAWPDESGAAADTQSSWARLMATIHRIRDGDTKRTIESLTQIARDAGTSTRVSLWCWNALRSLGMQPEVGQANGIRGVVMEVPMNNGADILAAYEDRTARYLNHSGKVIVWDLTDEMIGGIIARLIERANTLKTEELLGSKQRAAPGMFRVTTLTFAGNRFAESSLQSVRANPINHVLTVGAELMGNLVRRSEASARLRAQMGPR